MPNPYLPIALSHLIAELDKSPPSDSIIQSAQTFILLYPREELPDWVEILANGNPEMLQSVIAIAQADIRAEMANGPPK
jgi:hypothetical protein